ncbi:MAG: sigma-70 family RNA polymerase sigma factor, partial [Minisyncoccia bacterium]
LSALRKNDTSIALRCAVSKLPDEQQEIITLKFINDLSNREISRILGKKEDAIRQLQCRAIRNLKDIFKNNIKL